MGISLIKEDELWRLHWANNQRTRVRIYSKKRKLQGLRFSGTAYITATSRIIYNVPFPVPVSVRLTINDALRRGHA